MHDKDYDDLVIKAAETFRLDANLIRAIITVESSWNTWANRFEPASTLLSNARLYADKLGISVETEQNNQHQSWGLGQIIGFLARDLGFQDHLPMLCQPEIGIFYCCKYLQKQSQRYQDEPEVIAAYNAGSAVKTAGGFFVNQPYLNKVNLELLKLRKLQ